MCFRYLDLQSSYWQVKLDPKAHPKTAFTISNRLWHFRSKLFDLCNAPAMSERLIEHVLAHTSIGPNYPFHTKPLLELVLVLVPVLGRNSYRPHKQIVSYSRSFGAEREE